ncbi:hypothetical protein QBC37DRAFT_406579 [Rhypophila decipiens]|uniref:Phosphoglycerate mutase n=1 Tax=Rhypophila decipiens TaxID=261697 RepID=A0AAN7B134_9PEZI|nr:hypothetical protein QBC37DRAFT_406579 [Rhypophila decipiens]
MGLPPALLFVVRHGIRLDAADKQWHLSSPTPYDPPLTYNGWQQAKNLGARIGSLIRDRVSEDELAEKQAGDGSGKRKRKRYKVVIHSSPFLRCIQTSVAISAGLAQDSTPFGPTDPDAERRLSVQSPVLSPRTRPSFLTDANMAISKPSPAPMIRKSVLRLDAFLGEWLSPSYYELITPPPESVMMLASAKADLLRREDYTHYPSFSHHVHSSSISSSQGHLWSPVGRSSQASIFSDDLEPLSRSTSISSTSNFSTRSTSASSEASGYVAPIPHYAVSSNNTIPPGYVAHARDACVDIDYQWDSTRSPLEWEDGGTFPEEWTDMHRRFRKGIQELVDWYSTEENPTEMVTKTAIRNGRKGSAGSDELDSEDEDDVETEAVVIMVSHGAGCNAMIGAITHQPVLMDVGMASLTMAVRKPSLERTTEKGKESVPVHMLYDLKMFANTDHLRTMAMTPSSSRSPSNAGLTHGSRSVHSYSVSSSLNNFSFDDRSGSRTASANAALSSLRKSAAATPRFSYINTDSPRTGGGITVGSGVTSFQTRFTFPQRTPSMGLWTPISAREDEEDDDEDAMVLNFSHEKHATPATPDSALDKVSSDSLASIHLTDFPSADVKGLDLDELKTPTEGDKTKPADMITPKADMGQIIGYFEATEDSESADTISSGGLWGRERKPIDEADALRDLSSSKRRWTVTERS